MEIEDNVKSMASENREFNEIYAKYIDEEMDCCESGLIHSLHREYMHDNVESIDEEINGYQEAMKSYAIAMESNGWL
ncbi:hypothetical protein QR98_0015350 [Sarcoptes scabiei]|uniref:Uncharacterized protein n=1 Tax=Sarcoptes scabiei TaxID=52283 RepID=A0A131ZXT5_SARSC|nr:hypothetical protein QR98_0015350 [Sarcoptes scabiei]